MALKQIKNKIASTKKTGQVTKAMEAVSAVKMRKTQAQALESRMFVHTAMQILQTLSCAGKDISHPLLEASTHTDAPALLVVVTSDKGLAGSVNSAVMKQVSNYLAANPHVHLVAVGKKAIEFAHARGIKTVATFTNMRDDVSFEDVQKITDDALAGFTAGSYRQVAVVYQNFLNTFEQQPVLRTALPIQPQEVAEVLEGIGTPVNTAASPEAEVQYDIEPSPGEVLDALLPQLVQILFYHALVESKASEHSARMVAMKNATEKTKEMTRTLTLAYNKERQAAITAEVSEITGGIAAMAQE